MTFADLHVGAPVWVRKEYYRARDKSDPFDAFRQEAVTGETRVSWIISDPKQSWHKGRKVPKKGTRPSWLFCDEQELVDQVWIEQHRRPIINRLEAYPTREDAHLFKQIAALIGYEDKA